MTAELFVRGEREQDHDGVRRVLVEAFDRSDEARLVDALHAAGDMALALVAELDGIVGYVGFSRLRLEDDRVHALALAPLAVLPSHQRRGIGTALVREGVDRMRAHGDSLVLVLGDPAFYGRFGFDNSAVHVTTPYDGPHLQGIAFGSAAAAASGAARYPPAFAALR